MKLASTILLSVLILSVVLSLSFFPAQWANEWRLVPEVFGTVAIDANVAVQAKKTASSSVVLNHAANVLVIVFISTAGDNEVSSVTIGGTTASRLTTAQNGEVVRHEIWFISRTSAASETVVVTLDDPGSHAWIVASFTGTTTAPPFFAGTATATGLSNTPSVTVAAGTSGRLVVQGIASTGSPTVTPRAGQTAINEIGIGINVHSEANSESNTGSTVMDATLSTSQNWATIATAILPAFDFSLSNSGSITVTQGGSGSNSITLSLVTGSAQLVSLSCTSVLPAGASCSFSPPSGNPTFSSTLTISTLASTPMGPVTVTVTGTGGGLSRTTSFSLTVNAPAFDFSLSNSGGITVVQGGSGSNTVTVSLVSGSSQLVSLSCTAGLPTGASCGFNPLSGNPTFSSTLTIGTLSSTPTGSFTITVAGTGGGLSRTTAFTLTVNLSSTPPCPVTVAAATGTGVASFCSDKGTIVGLVAVAETTLPSAGKPSLTFPHGFFSFRITGVTPGDTVTVTITLPSGMPVGTQYWKNTPGGWINVTPLLGGNNGGNVLTLTLTDGGLGDDDGTANGVIVDQGGPGFSPAAAIPEYSYGLPLLFLAVIGMYLLAKRRAAVCSKSN